MGSAENFEINDVIEVSYGDKIFLGTIKTYNTNNKTVYYGEVPIQTNHIDLTIYAYCDNIPNLKIKLNSTLSLLIENKLKKSIWKTINVINTTLILN